jgi:hypothetical protein
MDNVFEMASDRVSLKLDLDAGHLLATCFLEGDRAIRPLHEAPWDVADISDSEPLVLRRLSGDFFCAPFCEPDVEVAPWHGWSANSRWQPLVPSPEIAGETSYRFELERRILGARLEKQIRLVDGHPLVYQRHIFHGGNGALPVAHHLMLRTDLGLKLSFSSKQFGLTPDRSATAVPGSGVSVLSYPQRFTDLRSLEAQDGRIIDASEHPYATATEDHIFLYDTPGSRYAWSAAVSQRGRYAVFALKDATVLPSTLLWISHYGLATSPFSNRHGDCLGVEELCSNMALGHAASVLPNRLSADGFPTAISLLPDKPTVVDYTFGCIAIEEHWREISNIDWAEDILIVRDVSGDEIRIPYRTFPALA